MSAPDWIDGGRQVNTCVSTCLLLIPQYQVGIRYLIVWSRGLGGMLDRGESAELMQEVVRLHPCHQIVSKLNATTVIGYLAVGPSSSQDPKEVVASAYLLLVQPPIIVNNLKDGRLVVRRSSP